MSVPESRPRLLDPCPRQLPGDQRLIIAFSGGADSTALASLVASQQNDREILCVHVDHGLDPDSGKRASVARSIATDLALPFCIETVRINARSNQESAARHARYSALGRHVESGDCLLTAHHRDDQIETIFLRLLRGAGPGGLAGIPRQRRFGDGWLVRPLLEWTRCELQNYCREVGLDWIEDPSNQSLSADRNFLRHRILPELRQRWSGLDHSVLRSGRLSGQAAESVASKIRPFLTSAARGPYRLDARPLEFLSDIELSEALRIWTSEATGAAPPGKPLDEFLQQVRSAGSDRLPELRWQSSIIRYWNHGLWLGSIEIPSSYQLEWRTDHTLTLPSPLGKLEASGAAVAQTLDLQVRSGRAGDRIELGANGSGHRVKDLLRARGIPPWQRQCWPRICDGDTLLAVGDQWIAPALANWLQKHQLELRWRDVDSQGS